MILYSFIEREESKTKMFSIQKRRDQASKLKPTMPVWLFIINDRIKISFKYNIRVDKYALSQSLLNNLNNEMQFINKSILYSSYFL